MDHPKAQSPPPRRVQFSLRLLLLFAAANVIALALFNATRTNSARALPLVAAADLYLILSYVFVAGARHRVRSLVGLVFVTSLTGIVLLVPRIFLRSRTTSNETASAASCKAYAEAQDIYRRTDYNKDGVLAYAQHLNGTNSLYETTSGHGDVGLIDRTFANAEIDALTGKAGTKAGYLFRILTAQGPHAVGGTKSYIQNGHMTQGYALIAIPSAAVWKQSGLKPNTFMISHHGTIYQADLGPQSEALARQITVFDPDPALWVVSE